MDKELLEIQNTILPMEELKDFKVFLFGSRVRENFRKNSDYDVGILGKKKMKLREYLAVKRSLDELPYSIDLVDFNRVSSDFKNIALKNISVWKK